jgi:predicted RNA-binding protein associated with RNAse of E/G family
VLGRRYGPNYPPIRIKNLLKFETPVENSVLCCPTIWFEVVEHLFMQRWNSGDQILLREMYNAKIWTETPVTIVQDERDLLVLYTYAGTVRKRPVDENGQFLRLPEARWNLVDEVFEHEALRLIIPESFFSVLALWTKEHQEFLGWYINLEDPLRRTSTGFDYLDQVLDIIVSPDRLKWYWKDEEELLEAQARGLLSEQKANLLRREGQRAIELLCSGLPPFDCNWEDWRPHRDWPARAFAQSEFASVNRRTSEENQLPSID